MSTALDKYIEHMRTTGGSLGLSQREEMLIRLAWDASQRNPEPHQGYRNYETFALGVLLENDQDLQKLWLARARAVLATAQKDQDFTRRESAELNLADQLKEHYDLRGDYLGWPNNLEPQAGPQHYLAEAETEQEARDICREWNKAHKPGRYSLKAEYKSP